MNLTRESANAPFAYIGRANGHVFKAELIERAAHFRRAEEDPARALESCPALVLNADYTPLSYYPLSLWPWQTAIKAVFLERVDIVAELPKSATGGTCT